jgi:hypothetical protein
MTVALDHDHGYPMIMVVLPFLHRSHVVVVGGFPPVSVSIVVMGVVIPSHVQSFYVAVIFS